MLKNKQNPPNVDSIPVSIPLTADEAKIIERLASKLRQSAIGTEHLPDSPDSFSAVALNIYRSRRLRGLFFDEELFSEPAWDMLLAGYGYGNLGEELTISGLCYTSSAPSTTALRWTKILESAGLLERYACATDGRKTFVRLTERARCQMRRYLQRVVAKLDLVM